MNLNDTQTRLDMGGIAARAAAVDGQLIPAVKGMMTDDLTSPKQWGLLACI